MGSIPTYYDPHKPVFGTPTKTVHGQMMAGVWVHSVPQARLLQRALELGMRAFAGRNEETYLAKCYNELELTISRARRESWAGWDDPATSPPPSDQSGGTTE